MSKIIYIITDLTQYPHEEEWFEFKENWFIADELGEYISALANSAAILGKKEAYFVWGVHNETHKITGTVFDPNQDVKGEPLKHYLARQMNPDNNFTFEEDEINGKRVVLLTIPSAKTVPLSFANERYIRIGSSKEKLRKYPEKESFLFAVLRNGFPTVENTPSQYQDLTFEKLLIYYGAKGIRLNEKTFKKNLGFYTEEGKYNLLAQLLSDDSHFTQRVAIFAGKTKTDRLYSVREFGHTCLLYTLDEVLRYGDLLNIPQADERGRIVERKEVPLFDAGAFREALINAFVHNKWVGGNEPMVTVFSDRIEILSRGTMPPEQTLDGFFAGESIPVNQKLSERFLQLHISEKTGRGVPEITRVYGKTAYEFRENSIVVTIPFNRINVVGGDRDGVNDSVNPTVNPTVSPTVNPLDAEILALMSENDRITYTQLAEKTNKNRDTIASHIKKLTEAGIIKREGADKNGSWKIISKDAAK